MGRTAEALPDPLVEALAALSTVSSVLVVVDFDGVMAPIRADRSAVRPLVANQRALQSLAGVEGVSVALLSGRTLAELREISQEPTGVILVGSHGSEVAGARLALTHEEEILRQQAIVALQSIARDRPGVEVEEKPVGAALHTRRARRDVALHATSDATLAATRLRGTHLLVGKEVVEILVSHVTKGDGLNRLRAQIQPEVTVYLGDDKTDEDAFEVMRPYDISVKVGEGPTHARFRIDRPATVAAVLTAIRAGRGRARRRDPDTSVAG